MSCCVQGCWAGSRGKWRGVGQAVDTEENPAGKVIFPQTVPYYDISAESFFGVWPCGPWGKQLLTNHSSSGFSVNGFVMGSPSIDASGEMTSFHWLSSLVSVFGYLMFHLLSMIL